MITPKTIVTDKAPALIGPYSLARVHQGVAYLSGQLPIDPATGALISDDVVEQTAQCLNNLNAIVEAAGATRDQILRVTMMVTGFDRMQEVNAVYADFFRAPYPARATFQVAGLPMAARIEMDAVVALAGERDG
ncbi:Rid family detoxifying hydrolase [Tropicimonas sp. IMCC34043]|uniref:Rid family detoxifying hydrolase n=1 Tax=Tropicimonas sp. IMCC34043 TaxID=2248760 RepID=UPI000E21F0EF|nr:Rid family detoxifying hydrolase [Tropicimonas sp. IMCC34043]